jgi:Protein of unknown function (DUF2809)
MSIRNKYLGLALALFLLEVLIATRLARIPFIRGSLSDILVVALVYFLVQALRTVKPLPLAIGVFLLACAVEVTQYFHLARALHLPKGSLFVILAGSTFSFMDILMYLIGSVASLAADTWLFRPARSSKRGKTAKLRD